jgi:hypothetical protein
MRAETCCYFVRLIKYILCNKVVLICGNKMPTRCNRCFFYCRSYCLLNMLRAPLCPSSGAQEYCTVGCRLLGFQIVGSEGCVSGLRAAAARKPDTTLSSTPYRLLENQAPKTTGGNRLYNTLELLMMGIMVPETCWASNKICNKKTSVASGWHFISTI